LNVIVHINILTSKGKNSSESSYVDDGKYDGKAKRVGKQEIQKFIGKRKGKETSKMSKVFMLANK